MRRSMSEVGLCATKRNRSPQTDYPVAGGAHAQLSTPLLPTYLPRVFLPFRPLIPILSFPLAARSKA